MKALRKVSYKDEFIFDGSLRDIYILNTTASNWQSLIDFLRSGPYKICYTGEVDAMPHHIGEIFAAKHESNNAGLKIYAGSVLIACHFFIEDEIEFDIDTRDIKTESDAKELFGFMCQIGKHLDKEVILTPESDQKHVIFKFDPNVGQIQYISCDLVNRTVAKQNG